MRAFQMGTSWGGLLAGPCAWAISTQLNYALVEWQCATRFPVIPINALGLTLIALAGGALSWRAWRKGGAAFKPERALSTERFVSMIGMLTAVLFAAVILMQGVAALILDECTR
ncbi:MULTISPECIES: hypothetical protein [unclassified Chelatococcus]|uniref:hypothetical protein n=1 Tax=unclassified Chelatococcus TaxID=2638111 RepID=UPI001BCCE914|nr:MULTISPECIES: hypothetical protein [unclassified Chelatococcus]MBS7700025.1 hypothetical protein [Chelatococcus sp. YT9]MBX3556718.1 hypothetical protein [Chelatococcus sp.]